MNAHSYAKWLLQHKKTSEQIRPTPLCSMFEHFGSNKFSHGYSHIYHHLFSGLRQDVKSILEIGVGTQDPDVHSTMNLSEQSNRLYKPGGSLLAWAEYFPNATVLGLDIADDCLVKAERVTTAYANQGDIFSIYAAALRRAPYDVIVDDGTHTIGPMFASFVALLPLLRVNGFYIIEDVFAPFIPTLIQLIGTYMHAHTFRGHSSTVIELQAIELQEYTEPRNNSQNMIVIKRVSN